MSFWWHSKIEIGLKLECNIFNIIINIRITLAKCRLQILQTHSARRLNRHPGFWGPCKLHAHVPCYLPSHHKKCHRPQNQIDLRRFVFLEARPPTAAWYWHCPADWDWSATWSPVAAWYCWVQLVNFSA